MALTRGGFRHYDYDRMVARFTMTNAATEVACAISSAAMDDLDGSTRTKTGQQAGHVTVSVSTTTKPIRWTTLAPIGQRSFFRVCAARRLASITTLPVRTFCGMLNRGLGEGTTAVCRTVSKSTALAALSLKRGKSVDFGGYWQRHSKDVHA
jgi:Protein of unknown function (DUF1488)